MSWLSTKRPALTNLMSSSRVHSFYQHPLEFHWSHISACACLIRDRITIHVKIAYYWPHPLCDLESGVATETKRRQQQIMANAEWKRLHLSGDLTKNFNLYSYIAMKVFPGNYLPSPGYHLPPFCCLHLESLPGDSMIERTVLQSISASMIFQ